MKRFKECGLVYKIGQSDRFGEGGTKHSRDTGSESPSFKVQSKLPKVYMPTVSQAAAAAAYHLYGGSD